MRLVVEQVVVRQAHGRRFRRPRRNDYMVFFDQRRGQDGGTGGISSIPWRVNESGDPRYSDRVQGSFRVPVGGRGGWDLNPPRRGNSINADEFWGTFGFPGQNGRNGVWVGEGGGGGAGGGHPGMVNNHARGHLAVWSGSGGQRGLAAELGGMEPQVKLPLMLVLTPGIMVGLLHLVIIIEMLTHPHWVLK